MNTQTPIPSKKSRDDLDRLTEEFTPDDVKFLVALNANVSLEECMDSANETIEAVRTYSKNNHSIADGGLKLKSVRRSIQN